MRSWWHRGPLTALAGLALAAGCAAGPPSEYLRPQGDGVTGRIGDLVVTNVLLDGGETGDIPPGGTATVRATIVNEGDVPDRLLAIASPMAAAGVIVGDSAVPARGVVSTGYGSDRPPLPGTPTVTLQLSGLVLAVQPGPTYPVDLTFAGAGTIRLELPVVDPVSSRPQR
jgi:hypothetical protein